MLQHLIAAAKLLSKKRSPQWPALEKKTREAHPNCAACGGNQRLQVHHKRPFHLHPELELDPSNLIVLCEEAGKNCHLEIGHGGSFSAYNPNVEADAAAVLANPAVRAARVDEAKANRLFQ